MEEDFLMTNELLLLTMNLQNFCQTTENKSFNKNVFSIKFKILLLIREYKNISPSTLVSSLNVAKSNIAIFCKALIKENLIISKHDEFDKRILYYCLTKEGENFLEENLQALSQHINKVYSEKEKKLIYKLLLELNNNISKTGVK